METFITEYTKQLTLAVTNHPTEYAYGAEKVPEVVAKMRDAIQNKNYNKDSRAFKETCKALKIKHTYTAINHFIANHA